LTLFSKENAIAFVDACEIYKVSILGIDAFYLYDNNQIQPSLEDSIDFSSSFYTQKNESIFADAKEFLLLKDEILIFEIVCGSSGVSSRK